ncbi:hypothetical protein F53441_2735 [Fusarium austroafricanum]|uniref:DUF7730 domain-containing protein n=1 Tax=Fusarium austroafricanum TaxID=2364996 RepID=A0A8H4KRG9_9HYPO|nr:hypothetical protein F53441_2735 [Fusarium austroafricanum]
MSYSPRSPDAEEHERENDAIWEERPREHSLKYHLHGSGYRQKFGELFFDDDTEPRGWRWWSARCHRVSFDTSNPRVPMTSTGLPGPWEDNCDNCQNIDMNPVGVMGWLLSCRQNYAETIDILYSTNILIMKGQALLTYLPSLIPPQRLKTITSLEITWCLKTRVVPHDLFDEIDESNLDVLLDQLSTSQFYALRNLYVHLDVLSQARISMHAMESYLETILAHLDQFQHMNYLEELAFAIHYMLFDELYYEATSKLREGRTKDFDSYRQIWRSSDGEMTVVQLPYVDSYPGPPYHLMQDGTEVSGYWILEEI